MKPPIYLTSPLARSGTHPLPMIEFSLVADHLDLEDCDTLMFSSKQAVISAERIDPSWKRLPTVAIGPATEKQIRKLGGTVLYRPKEYYGATLARDLVEKFRSRRILYLRPRQVSFDSRGYLAKAGIELQEQIIYETSCRHYAPEEAPPEGAVIVFTSPSTIHCFLENFPWRPDYHAVVIGRATLEHLPDGAKFRVASEPTIDACLAAARHLAETLNDTK
ncbi:MAG TPA: uroporphyrinogen-III synthase [Nitratifractor salsuginis]|uniref:Uroporphyrinogen-III synthase n=1 Tax=Nitratifractor salsuginis TaxID=269261 RepID=A0A7V2SJ92_9BACT|nr:uroporphyrinogen-III synthase [Nitratifractor salsuginis]